LLLDNPRLVRHIAEMPRDWEQSDKPGVALLRDIASIAAAYPDITAAALCERWRDTEQESVIRRLSDSGLIDHIPQEGREAELIGALTEMNKEIERERRKRMILAAMRASSGDDQGTDGKTEAKDADGPD
jgi:hypothetical protein